MTLPLLDDETSWPVECPSIAARSRCDSGCFRSLSDVRATYCAQEEFVHLDDFLPADMVQALSREVDLLRRYVTRKHVPFYKKSGSVSHYRIAEHAPGILGLYRDPAFLAFLRELTRAPLFHCPDEDPHATALYYYTQPGDRIGFHYDSSHYVGSRYTVLIGLVDTSSSRLVCQLYKDDPARETVEMRVAMKPGTMAVFNGAKLYHSVSPLGAGEERVVLTFEYVTNHKMTPLRRMVSNLKDAMTYFGFRELLRSSRPSPTR